MENEHLLKYCLYYKGEEECPFDGSSIQSTFWSIEEGWVKLVMSNNERMERVGAWFVIDFPDEIPEYDINTFLKATIYDQYCHFNGSKDGFKYFLAAYENNAPKKN